MKDLNNYSRLYITGIRRGENSKRSHQIKFLYIPKNIPDDLIEETMIEWVKTNMAVVFGPITVTDHRRVQEEKNGIYIESHRKINSYQISVSGYDQPKPIESQNTIEIEELVLEVIEKVPHIDYDELVRIILKQDERFTESFVKRRIHNMYYFSYRDKVLEISKDKKLTLHKVK